MLTFFEIRGCWCGSLDVWWMYRSYHVYSTEWTMLFDYLCWMSSILLDANTRKNEIVCAWVPCLSM